MRRFNIAYTISCVALAAFTLQACVTRTENLDNLNVITKPYSLHFADTLGLIYSTFDGERIVNLKNTDDYPVEALGSTDKYLMMVKQNGTILFVDDAGEGQNHNFNPVYTKINPAAFGNSMMINLPGYNDTGAVVKDRIYLSSSDGRGLVYSDDNAMVDSPWYLVTEDAFLGSTSVTSFTRLDDGTVIAFDDVSRRLWQKTDFQTPWAPITTAGLPAAGTGRMYITHMKNDVLGILIDATPAENGVYRSSGPGGTFSKLPSVNPAWPAAEVTCIEAVFGKVLIAGTKTKGIYRLDGQGNWTQGNIGLKDGIRINAITYKKNVFKNDKVGEYVYIATNKGVYRSDDLGQSWIALDVPTTENYFTAIH